MADRGRARSGRRPYIFFEQLFAAYVEVLLWLPSTPRRDELLRRAFTVSEQMFESVDGDVQGLVAIGLFEGRDPAWLKRAKPFVGRRGAEWLVAYHDCWRDCSAANDQIVPEILDGLEDPAAGLSKIHAPEGSMVRLQLDGVDGFAERCPEQYWAVVDCSAFVNWRRIEIGKPAVLGLSYYRFR